MLYWVHLAWTGFEPTMLVVIGTDCIGSCKSNYHTITTMTAPLLMIAVMWGPQQMIYCDTSLNWTQNNPELFSANYSETCLNWTFLGPHFLLVIDRWLVYTVQLRKISSIISSLVYSGLGLDVGFTVLIWVPNVWNVCLCYLEYLSILNLIIWILVYSEPILSEYLSILNLYYLNTCLFWTYIIWMLVYSEPILSEYLSILNLYYLDTCLFWTYIIWIPVYSEPILSEYMSILNLYYLNTCLFRTKH